MYSKEDIKNKIQELCKIENKEKFTTDSNLVNDFMFESIQIVKLIVDLEKEFEIVFDVFNIDIEEFIIVGNLVEKVYEMLQSK